MEWMNYHHLLYFWLVAREESIARASERLRLAPSTISGQLRTLEEALESKLFEKAGRGIALTDVGRTAYRYADEIFTLGRELQDTLKGRPVDRPMKLRVGIADVVPKLVSQKLLEPALSMESPVQVICTEGRPVQLVAELASHDLDVVLTDAPIGPAVSVKAYNHLLGESSVSIYGTRELVSKRRRKFPESLQDAPFLLPTDNTGLRRAIEKWFDERDLRPRIAAEFQDTALLKVFGQRGLGLFVASDATEGELKKQYGVVRLAPLEGVKERFYAVTVERRLAHPAVQAISEAARERVFE